VNPSKCVNCIDFPCLDTNRDCYLAPYVEVDPDKIRALMVSEATGHGGRKNGGDNEGQTQNPREG